MLSHIFEYEATLSISHVPSIRSKIFISSDGISSHITPLICSLISSAYSRILP